MGTSELLGNLTNCGEVTCDGLASRPGGVEILLVASCCGNQDKLWQHKPVLASRRHLTFVKQLKCIIERFELSCHSRFFYLQTKVLQVSCSPLQAFSHRATH